MSNGDPILLFEQLYEQKVAALKAEYEDQLAALKKKHDSPLIEWLLRIERRIKEELHHLGAPDHGTDHGTDHHILKAIHELKQEIHHMSSSIQSQIDANNVKLQADLDRMTTDLTAITAALQGAIPPVGQVVTQAAADAMTAQVNRLDAMATAMDQLAVPTTGGGTTHTAQDTSDGTPNGAARPDGTVRNNFFMPGFDPSQPETT